MTKGINLKFIKNRRLQLGFTQQDMADALGLATNEKYFRRESGQYNFQVSEIPALSKKLRVPIKKIFEL